MRTNWFYSDNDEHKLKSLDELVGLYYLSVGRGTNLFLNIGPDREGLLPKKDVERLGQIWSEITKRFSQSIASLAECKVTGNTWIYEAQEPFLLDHVVNEEDLTDGECIRRFQISIITAKSERKAKIYEGQNIGHKAIIRIPAEKASSVVLESVGTPKLRNLTFHYTSS